jgi:hypothetical protein
MAKHATRNTLAAIFTTSLVVGFSGTLMPGPLLTVIISRSAQRGFWQGPLLILGHVIKERYPMQDKTGQQLVVVEGKRCVGL